MDILNATIKLVLGLVLVLFLFRLFRKELAQVTPIDLLFLLILGDLFGGVAHSPDIPIWHLILIPIWAITIWVLEKVTQHKKMKQKIEGNPQLLIKNGQIIQEVMDKNRLNEMEIMHQLRQRGIFEIKDVEIGVLETTGSITAKKREKE